MTATETAGERIERVAAELGLTMEAEFVPFSWSRNAGDQQPSLNWTVTIRRNGKDVLTTDYMAGCGHCSAYAMPLDKFEGRRDLKETAIKLECNTGKPVFCHNGRILTKTGAEIRPIMADVLSSLASDAGAIDFATFDQWANEYDYDTDSRKAEATYRECLSIGLALRAALGEEGLTRLREACQDY